MLAAISVRVHNSLHFRLIRTPRNMSAARAYRLFVGNLPWTVSRKELVEYFTKFGKLRSAAVVFDKQAGMSRGFGFVEFTNRDGYTAAVSHENHILENSKLVLSQSSGGKKPEGPAAEEQRNMP
ncbi:hypothetical protein BaRGS_00038113 [Batillaria attramentaria]|uniref:RRM domain-containing protein n=1 Tax=Batillaria attramentaria TaxID=370345 RepID=A0ABD0J771_9CAEN